MKLYEFISLNSIFVDVDVDSKKNVIKTVANFFEKKNPRKIPKPLPHPQATSTDVHSLAGFHGFFAGFVLSNACTQKAQ